MTDQDATRFADVIDCEGSISIGYGKGGGFHLAVSLGMCHPTIPYSLHQAFGGTIYKHTPKKKHHSESYNWCVTGIKCKVVLELILPFLRVKTEQALIGLAFVETIRGRGDRKALTPDEYLYKYVLAERLRALNSHHKPRVECNI